MKNSLAITITEARKDIFNILRKINTLGLRYILTQKGIPQAIIMSADEFESWQETYEVLGDFPDLKKDIEELKRDIKDGSYKNYVSLENLLKQEGYIVAEHKQPYVSSKNKEKRAKRASKHS